MSLSEMITYSTVLIRCKYKDGTSGTGTGFIMDLCKDNEKNKSIPVIITNKHVVENNIECTFEFCLADSEGNPIDKEVHGVKYDNVEWIMHPNQDVDLCCLPLTQVLNLFNEKSIRIFYIPLETELIPTPDKVAQFSALENIVMIGYPIGLSDNYNHKPIIRRGSTATHLKNNYQGKNDFLVDMACFPGSSGSPIFILNEGSYQIGNTLYAGSRILLAGILYAGPQYSASGIISFSNLPNVPVPIVNIPTNLGIAIKSSEILEFEKIFNRL